MHNIKRGSRTLTWDHSQHWVIQKEWTLDTIKYSDVIDFSKILRNTTLKSYNMLFNLNGWIWMKPCRVSEKNYYGQGKNNVCRAILLSNIYTTLFNILLSLQWHNMQWAVINKKTGQVRVKVAHRGFHTTKDVKL